MIDICISTLDYRQFKSRNENDDRHQNETSERERNVHLPLEVSDCTQIHDDSHNYDVSQMWKEFKNGTTLHGLKYAGNTDKYKIRGCIWLVAVLSMMGCLIFTVSNLYVEYHKYRTNTNLNVELKDELPFPAVTVCNLSPFNSSYIYRNQVLKQFFIDNSILGRHDLPMTKLNKTLLNTSTILNRPGSTKWMAALFRKFASTLKFCEFQGKDICLQNILPRITRFGKCFTFNPWNGTGSISPLTTRKTGIQDALVMYLRIGQNEYTHGDKLAAGFKIVIHDAKDEPDVESSGFLVSPGYTTFAALSMTKKIYQPKPYMAFGDKPCLDTSTKSFVNPLVHHMYYSYNGCIRECKEKYILDQCGCRDYTHLGTAPICSFRNISECVHKHSQKFKDNERLKTACQCHMPCSATDYQIQTSFAYFPSDINTKLLENIGYNDLRTDYLEVRIFYDSLTLLKITQLPEYTIDGIIGTLGGQMGLFLGASLLTVSEFVEFCLLLLSQIIRRVFTRRCRRNTSKA